MLHGNKIKIRNNKKGKTTTRQYVLPTTRNQAKKNPNNKTTNQTKNQTTKPETKTTKSQLFSLGQPLPPRAASDFLQVQFFFPF